MSVAVFEGVSKVYATGLLGRRKISAVKNVTLHIRAGEVFGLLGPNRAGKTTVAKMLLSLCKPTEGRILRLGEPVAERRTLTRLGYMHETHAFPRYLNARELLSYYGALSFIPEDVLKDRVAKLLERVGLADRSAEPISQFSKGMMQRLGLAQALINEPELLILDEPGEGLDLTARQLLHTVVKEYRQQGRTVLLISHSLADVEQLCDRVAVLVQGRLSFVGPLSELASTASDPTGGLAVALRGLYEAKVAS